jgi:hypothetical protein
MWALCAGRVPLDRCEDRIGLGRRHNVGDRTDGESGGCYSAPASTLRRVVRSRSILVD